MLHNVFAVRDTKAEAFNTPFYLPTIAQAIRAFSDEARSDGSMIAKHPEDYVLFHLGSYDDANARFDMFDAPKSLGLAVEFLDRGQAV